MSQWRPALERTIGVVIIQMFIFFVRYWITNALSSTELVVKTFLVSPFLIFSLNLVMLEYLNSLSCIHQAEANNVQNIVAGTAIVKALVTSWSTTSASLYLDKNPLKQVAIAVGLFVIAVVVFLLSSYPLIMNEMNEKSYTKTLAGYNTRHWTS